jgi:hypothetical protein
MGLRSCLAFTEASSNKRMELTAPLGGRAGDGVVDAAASRSPFGERRRRSSSAVFYARAEGLDSWAVLGS